MSRFPKFAFDRYLLCVLMPGLLVSAIGLALLAWEGRQAAQVAERMQDACALNAIDEIREIIGDACVASSALLEAFLSFSTGSSIGA